MNTDQDQIPFRLSHVAQDVVGAVALVAMLYAGLIAPVLT